MSASSNQLPFDRILLSPEYLADPYRVYRQLRQQDPVHWSDRLNAWVLTRYEDVHDALCDSRLISGQRVQSYADVLPEDEQPKLEPLYYQIGKWIGNMDPPDHTRLRRLVNVAFTARMLQRLRPRVAELVHDLLDVAEGQREFDFIAGFAYPLPAIVIAEMLGVPADHHQQFIAWSDRLMAYSGTGQPDINVARAASDSAGQLSDLLKGLIDERRTAPRDDLISELVRAEDEGDRLTEHEMVSMCGFLLVAGHETTMSLLGNGMLALLMHPHAYSRLQSEPDILESAVEEFLRYDSPIQHQTRVASEDMQLGGRTIRRGQRVMPFLGAANRDGDQFPDPDRLDLARTPNKHLAFGLGIHYCIGAPLARLEAGIAFGALTERFQEARCQIDIGELKWRYHTSNRSPIALPVTLRQRASAPKNLKMFDDTMSTSSIQSRPAAPVETKYRRIATSIPAPETLREIEQLRAVEPRSMTAMPPILWHEAEGFLVRDGCGNQWIDLTSVIVLANAGHAHPKITEAIRESSTGTLATYAFPHRARSHLLQELVALSPVPDSKAILFCAGTEATESAMMLMRRHGQAIHPDKTGILSFGSGYHGRTLAANLASGSPAEDDWIRREQAGHYQIPFPVASSSETEDDSSGENTFAAAIASLDEQGITPDRIAGFIGEAVPGWLTSPIPAGYARALRDWCDRHKILLCFDEVQCGMGRTGAMYGFEHTGVVPDLFTLGKGLTSSLPVSALVGSRNVLDIAMPGEMSSTHGGNPVCVAAALANLRVLQDENLIERSRETGRMVMDDFRKLQQDHPDRIQAIRGRGLFISVCFQKSERGEPDCDLESAIVSEALLRGVLMFYTGRGFIKFTPPLGIDPQAALEASGVIRACVADLTQA